MNRRAFLRRLTGAGTALLVPALGPRSPAQARPRRDGVRPPNILIVLVDQLRYPQWFPDQAALDSLLPNIARLRAGAVQFGQHHVAANQCRPARATLLTGLYAHQTICLTTTQLPLPPPLQPGFPTWGTLLRELGYQAYWYGKWHLSASCDLKPYGFGGGTCPSPDGFPGDGIRNDATVTEQFITWLGERGRDEPWCTTVSFCNPHDVASYYRGTQIFPALAAPPALFRELPPNFETPNDHNARAKPRLQRAWINWFASREGGELPYGGFGFQSGWLKLLDLYLLCQQLVDAQIGRVLDAIERSPVAENTVIIFTADHGEYGGSHGMRGKAYGAYDEATRVPLYVKDPSGRLTGQAEVERTQLTSSVDLVPLLLTMATGGDAWRDQPRYSHLKGRLDLAAILRDSGAPGRPYILHTADEPTLGDDIPPWHVIAYRTKAAKLAVYSYWELRSLRLAASGQEFECYDYGTEEGRMEIGNVAALAPGLTAALTQALMEQALPQELREPLPAHLVSAQRAAMRSHFRLPHYEVSLPIAAR